MHCLGIDSKITLSDEQLKKLSLTFNILVIDFTAPDLEAVKNCEALLIHSYVSNEVLSAMKSCRYIGIRAHNLDYIDLDFCLKNNIKVTGIKAVAQQSVAEHAMAMIFALAKNLIPSHENVLSGSWRASLPLNTELYGKNIAIVGYGEIGQRVARISKAIGMNVLVIRHRTTDERIKQIISQSDVVSLHIPARKENVNYFDSEKISLMKKGAILVNTSRGCILDQDFAIEKVKDGSLAGLGLDVFAEEPDKNINIPKGFNIVTSPHVAFNTRETIGRMNDELIKNLLKEGF